MSEYWEVESRRYNNCLVEIQEKLNKTLKHGNWEPFSVETMLINGERETIVWLKRRAERLDL